MKCGVCFNEYKKRNQMICLSCFYVSENLSAIPPKAHVAVVQSQSYQAFGEMLKRNNALNIIELKMKLYSDSKDKRALARLYRNILNAIHVSLKEENLNERAKKMLELRAHDYAIKLRTLGGSNA